MPLTINDKLKGFDSLPKPTATKQAKDFRAELYTDDLLVLCKHCLGFKDVTFKVHGPIIDILQSESNRKLVVVPRGTLKSSIACVGYPIWRLLRYPNERILIDSDVYTNSKNFVREIRAHLESEKLTELFGKFESGNWNEGELTIKQRGAILKEASITAGGVGTTKVGQHYDVIIGDDYNNNVNSMTIEGRKKIIDHFKYNMSILEPGGTYVITATRYAEDDIPGFILHTLLGRKDIHYGVSLSDKTIRSLQDDSYLSKFVNQEKIWEQEIQK